MITLMKKGKKKMKKQKRITKPTKKNVKTDLESIIESFQKKKNHFKIRNENMSETERKRE